MGGALLSFCIMAVAVRELLRTMGSFEILFLRSLVSLVLVLAVLPHYGLQSLRTRLFGLHMLRNVLHFGGQYAWCTRSACCRSRPSSRSSSPCRCGPPCSRRCSWASA